MTEFTLSADMRATMIAWGVPLHESGGALWPVVANFVVRVDNELDVFSADRRARVVACTGTSDTREKAHAVGAFVEALGIVQAERPAVSQ